METCQTWWPYLLFFPQFLSSGCRHLLQSAAKGLRTATAGNSTRLSSSCGCWCPLLPGDWCCTPVLCPQVAVWIMLRNKRCHGERAFAWSSPPFGQHRLPSKCHCGLLLTTLAPREVWSRIQCLSVNLQDPQRTCQSWPGQRLPRGSDVLEQLLSPETTEMSLLRRMVEVRGRAGPLWLWKCPGSQAGRLERLRPRSARQSADPLAHRCSHRGKRPHGDRGGRKSGAENSRKKMRGLKSFWKMNIPRWQFGRWVSTFYVASLYFGIYKSIWFSEVLKVQDRYNDLRHSEFNIRHTLWKSSVLL